jgi:hypothetical protein
MYSVIKRMLKNMQCFLLSHAKNLLKKEVFADIIISELNVQKVSTIGLRLKTRILLRSLSSLEHIHIVCFRGGRFLYLLNSIQALKL